MAYDPENIFAKILHGDIPCDKVYEDDTALAFKDINPQAPVHFLVVPRKPIPKLQDLAPEDGSLIGHIYQVITRLAEQEGIAEGYRVVVNSGAAAGQTVFHLHFHVLGGRELGWPPG